MQTRASHDKSICNAFGDSNLTFCTGQETGSSGAACSIHISSKMASRLERIHMNPWSMNIFLMHFDALGQVLCQQRCLGCCWVWVPSCSWLPSWFGHVLREVCRCLIRDPEIFFEKWQNMIVMEMCRAVRLWLALARYLRDFRVWYVWSIHCPLLSRTTGFWPHSPLRTLIGGAAARLASGFWDWPDWVTHEGFGTHVKYYTTSCRNKTTRKTLKEHV